MSKAAAFAEWLDSRMPTLKREWNRHMAEYYAPKNFNFWYYFGVLSMVVLVIQLVTGVWLLMSYQGSAEQAFASVEYIMRRGYGLDYSLCPLHRCLGILRCGLYAHVSRFDLRLL